MPYAPPLYGSHDAADLIKRLLGDRQSLPPDEPMPALPLTPGLHLVVGRSLYDLTDLVAKIALDAAADGKRVLVLTHADALSFVAAGLGLAERPGALLDEEAARARTALEAIGLDRLTIESNPRLTMDELHARFTTGDGLSLLCLSPLGIMPSESSEPADPARLAARLAREYAVPVVATWNLPYGGLPCPEELPEDALWAHSVLLVNEHRHAGKRRRSFELTVR